MAGTALGAFLVPACMHLTPVEPPSQDPRAPTNPIGYRPMPGAINTASKGPREQFASGRSEPTTTVVARPAPTPAEAPKPAEPVESNPPIRTIGNSVVEPTKPTPPETTPAPKPAPVDPPRVIMSPAEATKPPIEPVPDAEGVIRPPKPVIPGAPPITEPPISNPPMSPTARADVPPPMMPPIQEAPKPYKIEPAPAAIGTPPMVALMHQANATPPMSPMAPTPIVSDGDSPLLLAVRAFQRNRPDEAIEHLKPYEPATQQILLSLMPAMVRLTEGKLQQMKPEEMDALLEQFSRVTPMLRPRASLQASAVRLCREVHTFAHVEPFPERYLYRAGDVVHLYMELANFSSVPDSKGFYRIELSSTLELRDGANSVVWRADPKDVPDIVSSPPQDYYRAFRLCVPNVPPGSYTLSIKTTDRPTGREVRKAVEFRVGSR